jgi:hypothetical protein
MTEQLLEDIYIEIAYSLLYRESVDISHICKKILNSPEINDDVLLNVAKHMSVVVYTDRHPKYYTHPCISMSHEQYKYYKNKYHDVLFGLRYRRQFIETPKI